MDEFWNLLMNLDFDKYYKINNNIDKCNKNLMKYVLNVYYYAVAT